MKALKLTGWEDRGRDNELVVYVPASSVVCVLGDANDLIEPGPTLIMTTAGPVKVAEGPSYVAKALGWELA